METDEPEGEVNRTKEELASEADRAPSELELDVYPVEVLQAVLRILKAQQRKTPSAEPEAPG